MAHNIGNCLRFEFQLLIVFFVTFRGLESRPLSLLYRYRSQMAENTVSESTCSAPLWLDFGF